MTITIFSLSSIARVLLFVFVALGITLTSSTPATALNTHMIEGYASELSAAPGQTINFKVSLPYNSPASQRTSYQVEIYRFGSSGSATPTRVLGPLFYNNGINQDYTPTSYVDGLNWANSFTVTVPTNWSSGIYGAKLTDTVETDPSLREAWVTFIVRSAPGSEKKIALLTSTNTYAAYNFWPGGSGTDASGSFYTDCNGLNGRNKISFIRPAPSAAPVNIHSMCNAVDQNVSYLRSNTAYLQYMRTEHLAAGDVRIARWLEKEGYSYSTLTDWDIDQDYAADNIFSLNPVITPTLIISTHNEYWSQNMYNAIKQYQDRGGNVMSLSGNTLYAKVILKKDANGNRTMERDMSNTHWSIAEKKSLLGIGDFKNLGTYCSTSFTKTSISHWAYNSPAIVPAPSIMGSSGEMKARLGECGSPQNTGTSVGWETDQAGYTFSRMTATLGQPSDGSSNAGLYYYQRPNGGSVFVAGSITFGQSLIRDASENRTMTTLVRNMLSKMSKPVFSDFTAADPAYVASKGRPDLLVRKPGDSNLSIYRSNGSDSMYQDAGPVISAGGWNNYDTILSVGDFDSDGDTDVIARSLAGNLHLFKSNGVGGFEPGTGAAFNGGWGGFNALIAPGDWDGDGNPDVLARTASGSLMLYRGNGQGNFHPGAQTIKTGMNGLTILGVGDFDYGFLATDSPVHYRTPGKPDLIARDATGSLRLYHGNGLGFYGEYDIINTGWNGMTLIAGGDWDGDSHSDILGCVEATGEMRIYHSTGGSAANGYIRLGYVSAGTGWSCSASLYAAVW